MKQHNLADRITVEKSVTNAKNGGHYAVGYFKVEKEATYLNGIYLY